ncbi:unnamed protein product [Prunus armeniaca]
MNPSHVVYGPCTRGCGVEGYGGPQGPWKLLDNGYFGLATWEHQSQSPLLRVLQFRGSFLLSSKVDLHQHYKEELMQESQVAKSQ